MGAMIPQDITQSKLIYFLYLRGYFIGSLYNKIVKILKSCDRFYNKRVGRVGVGGSYYTQSISKIFPANTNDSYCYNLECRHSFYPPLAPFARLGVNVFQQFYGRGGFKELFFGEGAGLDGEWGGEVTF